MPGRAQFNDRPSPLQSRRLRVIDIDWRRRFLASADFPELKIPKGCDFHVLSLSV